MNDDMLEPDALDGATSGGASAANEYEDEYALNDIGLALRLRALAD